MFLAGKKRPHRTEQAKGLSYLPKKFWVFWSLMLCRLSLGNPIIVKLHSMHTREILPGLSWILTCFLPALYLLLRLNNWIELLYWHGNKPVDWEEGLLCKLAASRFLLEIQIHSENIMAAMSQKTGGMYIQGYKIIDSGTNYPTSSFPRLL